MLLLQYNMCSMQIVYTMYIYIYYTGLLSSEKSCYLSLNLLQNGIQGVIITMYTCIALQRL